MTNSKKYSIIIVAAFSMFSCDMFKDSKDDSTESGLLNTLNQDLDGNSGTLNEYFYDFDGDGEWDDVDVKFNRWDFLTINTPILYDSIADTLNFKTFFDHLLTITSEDLDSGYTVRSLDTLFEDVTFQDSVIIQSHQFKNVEKMVWDTETLAGQQRYKPTMSAFIYADTALYFDEVFDSVIYRAVIDTPLIESGYLFIDDSEWVDTTYTYISSQDQYDYTFEFQRKQLGIDSLMYRENRDCDDDGAWDDSESFTDCNSDLTICDGDSEWEESLGDGVFSEGEPFEDTGNGIWDRAEIFYDFISNGILDDGDEAFEDRNCNGDWDDAEPIDIGIDSCEVSLGGTWYDSEGFCDLGNGIWDDAEFYTDLDENSEISPNELFNQLTVPNNLLVDYSDPDNPQPMVIINPGDDITLRFGTEYIEYENIIEEIVYVDPAYKLVDNIDSTVTLFTHQIVKHVEQNDPVGDYYITKTEWGDTDVSGGIIRDYIYNLYKKSNHINQLVHPSYFLPPGFYGLYFGGLPLDEGFWFENYIVDQVNIYGAPGQMLRDGETIMTDTLFETSIGDYHVQRLYQVNSEELEVPLREPLDMDLNGNGEWDSGPTVFSEDRCFKITNEITMTLIGPGVTYYERTTTWLARGIGVVKEMFEYHWNEDLDGYAAYEENERIEISEFRAVDNGGGSLLRILNNTQNQVKLNEFDQVPEFNYEPYVKTRTAGLIKVAKENN